MMNFEVIGLKDLFLAPIFLVSILFLAYLIGRRKYSGSPPLNTYFIAGLSLKLMGALAFTAIYQLYYSGGDTTVYYKAVSYTHLTLPTMMSV